MASEKEGIMMARRLLTKLGRFLRKIRIDRGELMIDMAEKLGVTPAFLSAVENGKRKPPKEWVSAWAPPSWAGAEDAPDCHCGGAG